MINSARFTTEEFKGDAKNPGVAMQPTFNILQSLTFAVMPDTEVDQGLLSWMNIQLPGSQGITTMSRNFFLVCEWHWFRRCRNTLSRAQVLGTSGTGRPVADISYTESKSCAGPATRSQQNFFETL